MGIKINELLSLEEFSKFHVVAGFNGLNKDVQGITVMEAPDCFKWVKGKELVLSSGYVIKINPDALQNAFDDGSILGIAALVVKRDRYISKIPDDILKLFDDHNIPLITMPFSISWMDLIRSVNRAAMNRTMSTLSVMNNSAYDIGDISYKDQKIRSILAAVEREMNFPAYVYDIAESKSYYSSDVFKKHTKQFNLQENDYWNPSVPCTKHVICDHINMTRFRRINDASEGSGARVSWITVPIIVNDVVQAYFVVMESRDFIDYFDEYSIRISYLMLQAVYEQLFVARSAGDVGFENFIQYAMNYSDADTSRLVYQAGNQGIAINGNYTCIVMRQTSEGIDLRSERSNLTRAFHRSELSRMGKLAVLDDSDVFLLLEAKDHKVLKSSKVEELINDFNDNLDRIIPDGRFEYGYFTGAITLVNCIKNIEKCRRSIEYGRLMFPEMKMWDYNQLGPFAWFNIPREELQNLMDSYMSGMKDEKNKELFETLKVYLNCNMNFSDTADLLFVSVNTVRKRIDKVQSLISVELNDPVERMKLSILLQFIK